MRFFRYQTAEELLSMIKDLEFQIASGQSAIQGGAGGASVNNQSPADQKRTLRMLYAAYDQKVGNKPDPSSRVRVREIIIDQGY